MLMQFCGFTVVVIGFLMGASLTVTERVNMTVTVCPQILEGTLERDVSVFATTMDMSAIGQCSTARLLRSPSCITLSSF